MEMLSPGPDGAPPPDRGRYSPSFAVMPASAGGPRALAALAGREVEGLQRSCAVGLGLQPPPPAPGRPPRPAVGAPGPGGAGGGGGRGAGGGGGAPGDLERRRPTSLSPHRGGGAGAEVAPLALGGPLAHGGRRQVSPRNGSPSPFRVAGSGHYDF